MLSTTAVSAGELNLLAQNIGMGTGLHLRRTDGSHLLGLGHSTLETTGGGSVATDGADLQWGSLAFAYPGSDLLSASAELPFGLGSATWTFSAQFDAWSWSSAEHASTVFQGPVLGQFFNQGISYADLVVSPISGSWTIEGPTEVVSEPFQFDPAPRFSESDTYWNRVDVDPATLQVTRLTGGLLLEAPQPTLAQVTVDGQTFVVTSSGVQATGTIEIPEPYSWCLLAAGVGLLLITRRSHG
jgi:hypothetical protein